MSEHWEIRGWKRDRSNGDYAYVKGNKRLYIIGTEYEWQVSEIVNGKLICRNYKSFEEALEVE